MHVCHACVYRGRRGGRYKYFLEPLLPAAEFKSAAALVDELGGAQGQKIHSELLAFDGVRVRMCVWVCVCVCPGVGGAYGTARMWMR